MFSASNPYLSHGWWMLVVRPYLTAVAPCLDGMLVPRLVGSSTDLW